MAETALTTQRQWSIQRRVIAVTVAACFFNFLFRAIRQLLCYTLIMFSGIPLAAPPPPPLTDSSAASWPSLARSRGVGD